MVNIKSVKNRKVINCIKSNMKQESSKRPSQDPDKLQSALRKEINRRIYSIGKSEWNDKNSTNELANLLNSRLQKLDLTKHQRLPAGSFTKG